MDRGRIDPRTGVVDPNSAAIPSLGVPGAAPGPFGAPAATPGMTSNPGVSNGMTPLTGFARQYTPEFLNDNIYESPWVILQDIFKGIDTQGPGYQAMRDLGGDPLALYNIMGGGNRNLDGGAGQFTNFMNSLYQALGRPGGQNFDVQELLGSIFRQKTGDNADSSLGRILSAGDAGQQVRTLFNLLRDVSSVGMNPLAATGYQAAAASAGDRYMNQLLKSDAGSAPSIVEWMNRNTPGLTVR